MKLYIKIFAVAFVCFTLMIGSGLYAMVQSQEKPEGPIRVEVPDVATEVKPNEPVIELTELEQLVEESKRFNVVLFGTDGARADTIIFASFDPDHKLVDIISIPRDTYHAVEGFDRADQHKINAVYGLDHDEKGGSVGVRKAIEELLQVPVDGYIKVSYNAVENIIDAIGGVEVNVHKHLKYDDPYAKPKLHINIPAGKQVLDGRNSVHYLRWRKNNGENGDGDIGRIQRQQAFVKNAIKKSISLKLPSVINTASKQIRTDISIDKITYYGLQGAGIDMSEVQSYKMPGVVRNSGTSYFIHDPEELETILTQIYNRGSEVESEAEVSN